MQHSHEALDRPGGVGRGNLLSPLRQRDFRILWTGMTISLIGDGIFLIAIAWESYVLWNAPAALSIVGIGMTAPMIVFLLAGGVVSDRYDRRVVMLWSDAVRAFAVHPACSRREGTHLNSDDAQEGDEGDERDRSCGRGGRAVA